MFHTIIHRTDWQSENLEDLWITLIPTNGSQQINLNTVYIPGDKEAKCVDGYVTRTTNVINTNIDETFILVGDYNVPSFAQPQKEKSTSKCSSQLMELGNLNQFNSVRSSAESNNLLDLVFSNRFLTAEENDDPMMKVDVFHPPLTIRINTKVIEDKKQVIKFRHFKRTDWKQTQDDLMTINWPLEFETATNIDEKVEKFYFVIGQILDQHCPEITKRNFKYPRWFSNETKKLLDEKRKFHTKWENMET